MSKMLTPEELANIIWRGCGYEIDDRDAYEHFLEDLGTLIADHFGGERGSVSFDTDCGWLVGFRVNECVPTDGGVYKDYDTDVVWENGTEK